MSCRILLVGCGNMGHALLGGWHAANLLSEAVVIDPSPVNLTASNIKFLPSPEAIPADFQADMIVLAIKPQIMAESLPAYLRFSATTPFLSIAAGKSLAFFERYLGKNCAVIRAMPNLPATVRQGVTVCVANSNVTPPQQQLATVLLKAVGTVHWTQEADLDAVTALSGSGPAYVFLVAEILAQSGRSLGLNPDLAMALGRETIIGAAELLRQSPDGPAVLRERVTSKGGTTEAALAILMEDKKLLSIFTDALKAAALRAQQLAD